LAVVDSDGTPKPRAGRPNAGAAKHGTFMERMEERWE
jgi:hypothetical protein